MPKVTYEKQSRKDTAEKESRYKKTKHVQSIEAVNIIKNIATITEGSTSNVGEDEDNAKNIVSVGDEESVNDEDTESDEDVDYTEDVDYIEDYSDGEGGQFLVDLWDPTGKYLNISAFKRFSHLHLYI